MASDARESTYGEDVLPLPFADRYAGNLLMFWLWAGGNVLLTTFLLGGYYAAAVGAVAMIVISFAGNILGCLWPSMTGLRSARYGVDEYVGMRSTFGTFGAYIGVFLLVTINFGWVGILANIAGASGAAAVQQVTRTGDFSATFGLNWFTLFALVGGIVIPVAMLYVSPKTVFTLVKWTVPLLLIFAAVLLIKLLTTFGWQSISAVRPNHSVSFAYGIEAAVAYNISWFPYMGSWNRFAKSERGAFWGAWIGLALVGVLYSIIGGLATLATGAADPSVWATRSGLGLPALYIIILSTIINVAMLLYASVMGLKVALPKLNYHLLVAIIALPSIPFLYQGTLNSKFNEILTVVGALLAPYWGVALGDYFLLRRQRIHVANLYRRGGPYWFTAGFNLGAILTWLVGVALWVYLAGWTTTVPWIQNLGRGASLYNVITASTPVIVVCALLYYLIGYRLGYAWRSPAAHDSDTDVVAARPVGVKSAG